RALLAAVIDKAEKKLAITFGYELKDLQRTRPSRKTQTRHSQQSAADMISYIVVSQLHADKKYVKDINTAHLTVFTFVIVTLQEKSQKVRHNLPACKFGKFFYNDGMAI
ncbi:ADP-ribosylation factor-like protein 6-interacting protein 6, partial [Bienertia sinuspersici]